jgi:hypothetical protein
MGNLTGGEWVVDFQITWGERNPEGLAEGEGGCGKFSWRYP